MFPSDSDFEARFGLETGGSNPAEELPFHILLLGDWTGDGAKAELDRRRPVQVDRDNFDEVMEKLKVSINLDLHGDGLNIIPLEFSEIDDFHPDNLFRQVSVFGELRDLRRRLLDPETFNSAANEVQSWLATPRGEEQKTAPGAESAEAPVATESLLDEILLQSGGAAPSQLSQPTESNELSALIGRLVSPYLVRTDEAEQQKLISVVDEATSDLMRKILHHPAFKSLESAWRGLFFLVRRVETDAELKIFILDLSKEELIGNLKAVSDLTDSALYKWLIRETLETPGGKPYALFGGSYGFGLNVDDVAALVRLAMLADAAEAPFFSYLRPEMFGFGSVAEALEPTDWKFRAESPAGKLWSTLRALPESKYVSLSPMRFLSRMPYGALSDSTETFAFEEFTGEVSHESYLWSNPCFACALLLAQSFSRYGWGMGQNMNREIGGLPLYIYREDGEAGTKPAAEVVLTETVADKLLEQGLMPLLSFRDSDRIRVPRFQAVAESCEPLKGKWNS